MLEGHAESDQFASVFAHFDPGDTGYINTKDFLNIIDKLDALQSDDAKPVFTGAHRLAASKVIEAAIPMSKTEVIDFLETLGMKFCAGNPLTIASDEEPNNISATVYEDTKVSLEVPSKNESKQFTQKVRSRGPIINSGNELLPKYLSSSQESSLTDFEGRKTDDSLPLAQSTPHKDLSYANASIETNNQKHLSNPEKLSATFLYAALGEGTFSPSNHSNHRSASGPNQNVLELNRLKDSVNYLQEREKANERTIASSEHEIHQLESLLEQSRAESVAKSRTISDLRTSCGAAEHNVRSLESEIAESHKALVVWKQREITSKTEAEALKHANERLESQHREQSQLTEDLRVRLAAIEDDFRSCTEEKQSLLSQISGLQTQCNKLAYAESQLIGALDQSADWKQHAKQKTAMGQPQVARNNPVGSGASGEDCAAYIDNLDREQKFTYYTAPGLVSSEKPLSDEWRTAGSHGTHKDDQEALRRHYATLNNELGLQHDLIETMSEIKSKFKRSKSKGSRDALLTRSTRQSHVKTKDTWDWTRLGLLVALYSLFILLFGYLIASQKSTTSTSGVTYAEMKAWDRANSIEYLLDYHGVIGPGHSYRWWEGGWVWVEMLGYWLEDKLQDRPWPS